MCSKFSYLKSRYKMYSRHQKNPKKQPQDLEFRFGEDDKSLPSNVLAFVGEFISINIHYIDNYYSFHILINLISASATAESDSESVIEEFPTVTIEDDNESLPGPSSARLPIINEKFELNDSDNESDVVVIKVESNRSRKINSQNLMIGRRSLSGTQKTRGRKCRPSLAKQSCEISHVSSDQKGSG